MEIPSRAEAERLLDEAENMNPGPWAAHSRTAATAAQRIAACVPGMDAESAYILGLLHDIGRRYGIAGMRHITDGHRFMTSLGYSGAARICMTHSFPLQIPASLLDWDGSEEDKDFVYRYIPQIAYDDYDRLIQLADALALPQGFCLIEKRMVDVALRYGFNDYTLQKWQAHYTVKHHFESKIGRSIYTLLPEIIDTIYSTSLPTATLTEQLAAYMTDRKQYS